MKKEAPLQMCGRGRPLSRALSPRHGDANAPLRVVVHRAVERFPAGAGVVLADARLVAGDAVGQETSPPVASRPPFGHRVVALLFDETARVVDRAEGAVRIV